MRGPAGPDRPLLATLTPAMPAGTIRLDPTAPVLLPTTARTANGFACAASSCRHDPAGPHRPLPGQVPARVREPEQQVHGAAQGGWGWGGGCAARASARPGLATSWHRLGSRSPRAARSSKRLARVPAPAPLDARQVCNHPMLSYPPESWAVGDAIVRQCGKMLVLDRLLVKMKLSGHRWASHLRPAARSCLLSTRLQASAGLAAACARARGLWSGAHPARMRRAVLAGPPRLPPSTRPAGSCSSPP